MSECSPNEFSGPYYGVSMDFDEWPLSMEWHKITRRKLRIMGPQSDAMIQVKPLGEINLLKE